MSYVYTSPPTTTTAGTGVGYTLDWTPPAATTGKAALPRTDGLRPPKDDEVRDGVMLALYPDPGNAADLVLPGGTTPAELHLTVGYLGKTADVDGNALQEAAERIAAAAGPIPGLVSGHARFTGGDDGDVLVALFDSPALEQLRRITWEALDYVGLELNRLHGYTPHLTLGYLDVAAWAPIVRLAPRPLTFTALSVVYGPERLDLPLTGAAAYQPGMDRKSADVGDFVIVAGRVGRVDLVVAGGQQVPAAEPLDTCEGLDVPAVVGTKDHPAARVVEYVPAGDGTFTPTGNKYACPVEWLSRTAPLRTGQVKSLGEALSWARAAYEQYQSQPPPTQMLASVFERGVKSWPGPAVTTLDARQWGLGRVDAFAATWHGLRPAGYHADDDLLPSSTASRMDE